MTAVKNKNARRTRGAEETTFLDLMRTAEILSHPLAEVLKGQELSLTQYNVLRILRGAPEGLPCGEVGNRMITREPDITRLFDRLEKRNLIARARDEKDRRVVIAKITPEGLDVLAALDGPVQETHQRSLGHLGSARLAQLSELLAACRAKAS